MEIHIILIIQKNDNNYLINLFQTGSLNISLRYFRNSASEFLKYPEEINYRSKISSRSFSNFVSEFLKNIEDIFLWYYMHMDI